MSNDTRARNVSAEQRDLIRVAIPHRMGRLEQYIANNREFLAHGATAEAREAAGERLIVQLATLAALNETLKLVDNV